MLRTKSQKHGVKDAISFPIHDHDQKRLGELYHITTNRMNSSLGIKMCKTRSILPIGKARAAP